MVFSNEPGRNPAGALAHNFRQIRRKVGPDCKIMAVVKADGYGHGDRQVAQVFQREGANWFARLPILKRLCICGKVVLPSRF